MMGELEKRIVAGLNLDNYIGWKEREAWEAAKKGVLDLFEEARKDFPLIALGNEVASTETILEVQKWRVKWFGDGEEKEEKK